MLETDDMRVRRNVAFTKMSNELTQLRADLARRDEIIKRLVEDGERLIHYAEMFCLGFEDCRCSACGKLVDKGEEHAPDCPITLHRALMKELDA